jgi:hypothetical protein
MTENTDLTTPVELTEGQIDLITEEVVEIETEEETDFEQIVTQLTNGVFGQDIQVTAYKIHKVVNAVFEVHAFDKKVPPQMMYNYAKNGMINGIKNMKQTYTKDEVTAFVIKYTQKQMSK